MGEGGGWSRPRSRSALVGLSSRLLAFGQRAVQRLEVLGDHLDAAAGGAVLRLPGAAVEAALDVDQPALSEELAGELGVLPPDHDVVELGGIALVGGDPQGADRQAGGGEAELWCRGEAADEISYLEWE